jgi:hypothetical protein
MTTLTIGEPVPDTHTPHSFEVEVTAMFGDADGYETIVVGPFLADNPKSAEAVVSIVQTLKRMEAEYPNGRGGGGDDEYYHVPGYEAWFGAFAADTEELYLQETRSDLSYEEFRKDSDLAEYFKIYPDWPYDTHSDSQASYDAHEVFYYDQNRVKHTVAISEEVE